MTLIESVLETAARELEPKNQETFDSKFVVLSSELTPSKQKAFRTFLNCPFIAPVN